MIKACHIFILVLLSISLHAQYVTPGDGLTYSMEDLVSVSGGVVTYDDGNYLVHHDLTISSNDVLTILEDITVQVAGGKRITINGTLVADPPEQAVFTAIDPQSRFLGFRFDDAVSTSVMRNTIVEYAGGIQLINTNMLFDHCTIRFFDMSNTSAAINLHNSNPVIQHSLFLENAGSAIGSGANIQTSPQVLYNEFISNGTANTNRPQINLGPSANDTLKIIGNTIIGEYDMAGGIAVANSFAVGNSKVLILDNHLLNNRYGITVQGGSINAIIHNNSIIDNNIQGQPMMGGSGLNFIGSNTNVSYIKNNIIKGNLWGITIQGNAQPNLGETGNNLTGYNVIENNENSGIIYALYNNTPGAIMAQHNYWGTDNEEEAANYIFDLNNDMNLGPVTFIPIWVPENIIESFVLESALNEGLEEDIQAIINQEEQHIHMMLPAGTDLTALIPTIIFSDYAEIDPPSGSSIDLGATATYTVTAFHNEERIYTVTAETEEPEMFTVVFNVEVAVPQFDHDVHHVMITGTMTNWAEPGTDPDLLMDKISDDPLIYSKTFNLDAGVYQYKYFSNYFGEGWYGGEWPGDPNREIAVSGDMTVEDIIFFHHGSVLFIITDQDGNEIPDATVTLFSGYNGEITNQPGDYFFGWLWIGTYDYIVEKEGYHSVEGTVDVYCCATEEVTLTATDVSVTQQEGIHTRMYPNPASTRFTVSSNEKITAIEVISLHGQLMHAASVAGNKHDVVVSGLIPGVYFVRITTRKKEYTKRLQVVR